MIKFSDLSIGDLFTNERKIKNNPHKPTLWRKKSSRTARVAECHDQGKDIFFYFGKNDSVYKKGSNNA